MGSGPRGLLFTGRPLSRLRRRGSGASVRGSDVPSAASAPAALPLADRSPALYTRTMVALSRPPARESVLIAALEWKRPRMCLTRGSFPRSRVVLPRAGLSLRTAKTTRWTRSSIRRRCFVTVAAKIRTVVSADMSALIMELNGLLRYIRNAFFAQFYMSAVRFNGTRNGLHV